MSPRSSHASPTWAKYPSSAPIATAQMASKVNSITEIASTKACDAPMHFIKATVSMWRDA